MTSITPVTLANCEDEPIHVPGAIQPHGALIALRADGMVLAASENIQALLGFVASPGSYLTQEQVGPEVLRMLEEGLTGNGPWSNSVETRIGEHLFDVIGHSYKEVFYLEFEIRTADTLSITSFTLNAQRIIAQVQLHNDTASLLSNVTDELRRMTGYDRVMAYRFVMTTPARWSPRAVAKTSKATWGNATRPRTSRPRRVACTSRTRSG